MMVSPTTINESRIVNDSNKHRVGLNGGKTTQDQAGNTNKLAVGFQMGKTTTNLVLLSQ